MLQTRVDLENEFLSRAMVANNSALFPAARVTELADQATKWAASFHFWPPLQRARVTTAAANTQSLAYDYYDYPTDYLTGSISRLYIDGKKYEQKSFQSLLDYVDQATDIAYAPDSSKHYFANYGRQYFVYPTYSGTGTSNLIVWGNVQHTSLANPSDTTIFSNWDDAGNEAIVRKMLSVALARLESAFAASQEQGAIQLLEVMWKKVTDEMQKGQQLNHPLFNVPDFFTGSGGVSTVGQFNTDVIIGR